MANLCKEYQIDWLLDKIEGFLNEKGMENLNMQLKYLQLVQKMGFKDNAEIALVNQITTAYFPVILGNPLFAVLDRSMKLKIAIRRLRNILNYQLVVNPSLINLHLNKAEKDSLIYDKEHGLMHFFQNK